MSNIAIQYFSVQISRLKNACFYFNFWLYFCSYSASTEITDNLNQPFNLCLSLRINLRARLRPFGDDQIVRPRAHAVPQFLGDERHERMQHDEYLVEHPARDFARLVYPPLPSRGEGRGEGAVV